MKQIILIAAAVITTTYSASLSTQDIDKKVSEIQATRNGMNVARFETMSDPFVYFDRNASTGAIITPKMENVITIGAIMNGKAYIDGNWKKVGDKVGSYTIKSIGTNVVTLKNGGEIKKLFIGNKQENSLIKLQGR
jgi:hypothetical protein